MWGRIAVLLAEALKKVGPDVLRAVANRLGTLVRANVPASVEGILAAAKKYVAENPAKAALVVSVMAEMGIKLSIDVIEGILGEGGGPPVNAVLQEIRAREKERMEKLTGDGDPSTVHGVPRESLNKTSAVVLDGVNRVKAGARMFGSVEAFRQARELMLLTEEDDFVYYYRSISG